MRLSGTKATAIHQYRGLGSQLWDLAGVRPSLDLPFADQKSLIDATTGSNLVDFTRASSGTYVGSDGLIKTATTNLLLQSEDLTVSPWSTAGSVAITADSSQGVPFSGASVYKIEFSGADESVNQVFTYLATQYTASIWLKGTPGEVIRFSGKTGQAADNFTLNGTWQRLAFVGFTAIAGAANFALNTFGAATARVIYVAAPQLEQSTTVGEYIPTTTAINSAPRFDHDPTTGESLGLLVEESRTNLLQRSEEFDDAYWTANNCTILPNDAVSPAGTITAEKQTHTGNGPRISKPAAATVIANSGFTFSFFAKAGTSSYAAVSIYDGTVRGNRFWFNIATGAVGGIVSIAGGYPSASSEIEAFPNGWYRCICTITNGSNTTVTIDGIGVCLDTNGQLTPAVSGVYGYVWGAQLEAGSFPTSYIKNVDAVLGTIRAADVASDTSTGADIRTLYARFRSPASGTRPIASLDDNTANERIELLTSGTDPKLLVTDGGSAVADLDAGTITVGTSAKLVARFATDNYAAAVNGETPQADTGGTLPTVDRLRIGSNQAGDYFNGTIARLTGWSTSLPDETLRLTTG